MSTQNEEHQSKFQNETKAASFEELNQAGGAERTIEDCDFNLIMDIPVTISLEVGKAQISIKKLLTLTPGSTVELDKDAGQPLDVMVNGTLIAHADVVVIDDRLAIKLVDVISKNQRVELLN